MKWRVSPVWLLTYLAVVLVMRLSLEPGGFAHLHAAFGLPLLEEFQLLFVSGFSIYQGYHLLTCILIYIVWMLIA